MYFRGLFAFKAYVPQAHTLYIHKTDKLDNKEESGRDLTDRQPARGGAGKGETSARLPALSGRSCCFCWCIPSAGGLP